MMIVDTVGSGRRDIETHYQRLEWEVARQVYDEDSLVRRTQQCVDLIDDDVADIFDGDDDVYFH